MYEEPGQTRPFISRFMCSHNDGKEAVAAAQKWLDYEDSKQGNGVQLFRFEDNEYRKLSMEHCRKMYTVVAEEGKWKKSYVVWTEAVLHRTVNAGDKDQNRAP